MKNTDRVRWWWQDKTQGMETLQHRETTLVQVAMEDVPILQLGQ